MPYGKFGQFGNIEKLKFVHDRLTLIFYCFVADSKKMGDLLGAFSVGDQLQDLAFPRGEIIVD